jgi:hypothetical protein
VSHPRAIAAVIGVACAITPAAPLVAPPAALAKKLHAGEFCSKRKQSYYHRHGYTCRRASDGRNRLFSY